jgi:hypothetical protein
MTRVIASSPDVENTVVIVLECHNVTCLFATAIMSSPKERHYWAQLRAALTAGQWRSPAPAKTPSGALLSWSELFRKFNKHCRGAHDVAHAASHTYTLALCILEDSLNEDEDSDVLTLGIYSECQIPRGRAEKTQAGYEELQSLQSSSNLDVTILSVNP